MFFLQYSKHKSAKKEAGNESRTETNTSRRECYYYHLYLIMGPRSDRYRKPCHKHCGYDSLTASSFIDVVGSCI